MSKYMINTWEPESAKFWSSGGSSTANRNLWISIPALALAFAVWMVWSVVVVNLPAIGFQYSTNQLFWLTALPGLSGATLRIFYSFMVPIFGGRKWTTISTASLLIPAIGIGFAVQDVTTGYPTMLILALLCGFGGGNFASSMANISFFYPKAQKGYALGMNDLASAKASFADQAVIFKRKHNWLMCWLYTGTFGSFIGYSAGFPLLIKTQFPDVNPLQYAFLGPLVGALARVIGGIISDKLGGARVTVWTFAAMIAAVYGVITFLPQGGTGGNFTGFFWMFMLLFAGTGVGNASTFRMIPIIFLTERQRAAAGQPAAVQQQAIVAANKEGAAVLGFTSAVAAYGAFFIPKSYGTSIAMTGGPDAALWGFIAFYVSCIAITWWCYARKNADMPC